jgi:hypothetical protein
MDGSSEHKLNDSTNFVTEYCDFKDDRAYILMAISRRKFNEDVTNSQEKIHRRIVSSEEEVEYNIKHLYSMMQQNELKYRLYLTVNPRSLTSAFFQFQSKLTSMSEELFNGDDGTMTRIERLGSEWKSTLHDPSNRVTKNFQFDVDGSRYAFEKLLEILAPKTEILLTQETPNGFHIITEPFNHTEIEADYLYDEMDTDGMVHVAKVNNGQNMQ